MAKTINRAKSHTIVIAGGGSAGLAVAATLLRQQPDLDVAIIDPAEYHYYQPGFSMLAGGHMRSKSSRRRQERVIPRRATWIKDAVAGFSPLENRLTLSSGELVEYDFLVVALGVKLNWNAVSGLAKTLGKNGVCSCYRHDLARYTRKVSKELKGARALFTEPAGPIKCAAAPQNALYFAADLFRRREVDMELAFYSSGETMFSVPAYAQQLDKVLANCGADAFFGHHLISVDGRRQEALFRTDNGSVLRHFDMLHVVPPQLAPDVVRRSDLAGSTGWVSVDPLRLAHTRYENIFALGDCTDLPNAKTLSAVRGQVGVVVSQLRRALGFSGIENRLYDGYSASPLPIGRGKVLFAESRYDNEVVSSLPLDPRVPRRLHWQSNVISQVGCIGTARLKVGI